MHDDFAELIKAIVNRAERIIIEYPLCNSCLGRLFAKYGIGLSNRERGLMVKSLLAIKLYEDYSKGVMDRDIAKTLARNANEGILTMYLKLFNEPVEHASCYLCMGRFNDEFISGVASEACKKLAEYEVKKFLVGVVMSKDIASRELELITRYGVESSESIKKEIKREVGKAIASLCNATPSFSDPEAIVILSIDSDFNYEISVQLNPLFFAGRYFKMGRRISHVPWYTKTGVKKYPISIQEVAESIFKKTFEAESVVIHAAGREDVDARMIGSGRPLVVEVKSPRRRGLSLDKLRYIVELELALLNAPVRLEITSTASRQMVTSIKERSKHKRKMYRIVVYSAEKVDQAELNKLEGFFVNREVRQKTPTRILRRKKERERLRKVHAVKTLQISEKVFEALVYCDGGLYVKELVHCDGGRTWPCFSGILGKKVIPAELDVIYVEE